MNKNKNSSVGKTFECGWSTATTTTTTTTITTTTATTTTTTFFTVETLDITQNATFGTETNGQPKVLRLQIQHSQLSPASLPYLHQSELLSNIINIYARIYLN